MSALIRLITSCGGVISLMQRWKGVSFFRFCKELIKESPISSPSSVFNREEYEARRSDVLRQHSPKSFSRSRCSSSLQLHFSSSIPSSTLSFSFLLGKELTQRWRGIFPSTSAHKSCFRCERGLEEATLRTILNSSEGGTENDRQKREEGREEGRSIAA